MANDCIGEEVERLVAELPEGGVLLLENVRFYNEEVENDHEFAKKLASLADLYVNDAFGTAHRAHASTVGMTTYLKPAVAGFLMQEELDFLVGAVLFPTKPFAAIVGGADIFSKRRVIEHLLDKVDIMLLGGNLIFSFLIAQGLEVRSCVVRDVEVECATKIVMMAKSKGVSLLLPSDMVITDDRSAYANSMIVPASAIPADWVGVDIGPDTIKTFGRALKTTKTIVWNGLMGTCEAEKFVDGTKAIARIFADLTKTGVKTIIGGSDTISAVEKFGLVAKMNHISTGGGASLNLLQGEPLISVLALNVV